MSRLGSRAAEEGVEARGVRRRFLYDVHIYALVRVKVVGVAAGSQQDAVSKANGETDLDAIFRRASNAPGVLPREIDHLEFADETLEFLVDEVGDEDYSKSRVWRIRTEDGELEEVSKRHLIVGRLP